MECGVDLGFDLILADWVAGVFGRFLDCRGVWDIVFGDMFLLWVLEVGAGKL